jgi:hypothetical protein
MSKCPGEETELEEVSRQDKYVQLQGIRTSWDEKVAVRSK